MGYGVAVGIFLTAYVLAFVLPLVFGNSSSIIRLVAFTLPVILVLPRILHRRRSGDPLVPEGFRRSGGVWYGLGVALVWLGHLCFFGAIAVAVYLAMLSTDGVPIGLLAGYAMYPYLVGICFFELAFRQWSSRQGNHSWTARRKPVFIAAAIVLGIQLTFNLTTPQSAANLLGYTEFEALAYGRGYAQQVQGAAERFYTDEGRLPCVNDRYIDIDSLLASKNRTVSSDITIALMDCGQFVVNLHRRIDGVTDGKLLYVSSPGDASAGRPLNWQCFGAHHVRIERITNGNCTYDPSLALVLEDVANAQPRDRLSMAAQPESRRPQPVSTSSRRATEDPGPDRASASRVRPDISLDPSIRAHLDRLFESDLSESCVRNPASYRLLRFDASQYVAAVRIETNDAGQGAFKSTTSTSPNSTIGADGHVDQRMLTRIESAFAAADFWRLPAAGADSVKSDRQIFIEACRNGDYHAIYRPANDSTTAAIANMFASVGRLEWLEN